MFRFLRRQLCKTGGLVAALLSAVLAPTFGQGGGAESAFVAWAGHTAIPVSNAPLDSPTSDLARLRGIVGEARIVALAEAGHGVHEPLAFRNRLFRYLVEDLGFTAIAIESGISEGERVYRHVLGGNDEMDSVLAEGFSWTFGQFPESRALVEWLRGYNADPRHSRKVRFYGFDMTGSPGALNQGIRAMDAALRYLRTVDSAAADSFGMRVEPLRGYLTPARYGVLNQESRDRLTGMEADLVSLLERQALAYAKRTGELAYRWGYRHAIAARQVDAWLRLLPSGWTATASSPVPPPSVRQLQMEARDRAMADNLDWIMAQEGPNGRVLVFASMAHLVTAPWRSVASVLPSFQRPSTLLGQHLKHRWGGNLLTVGQQTGGGRVYTGSGWIDIPAPELSSLAGLLDQVGPPEFVLDLRRATPEVRTWLGLELLVWPMRFVPADGLDALFYSRPVTSALRPAGQNKR